MTETKFVFHLQILTSDLKNRIHFEEDLTRVVKGIVKNTVITKEEFGTVTQFQFELPIVHAMRALPKLSAFIERESADDFLPLSLLLLTNPHYQTIWEYSQRFGEDGQYEFTTSLGPGCAFMTTSKQTKPKVRTFWCADQENNKKVRKLLGLLNDDDS